MNRARLAVSPGGRRESLGTPGDDSADVGRFGKEVEMFGPEYGRRTLRRALGSRSG